MQRGRAQKRYFQLHKLPITAEIRYFEKVGSFVEIVSLSPVCRCLSLCLPFPLSLPACFCGSVCLSLSVCLCLSLCLSLSLSLCVCVCLSVSLSLSLSVCLSLSLCV